MESDPAYTAIVQPFFAAAEIDLTVVQTPDALLAEVAHLDKTDMVFIDCTLDQQRLPALLQAGKGAPAPLYVFHPREETVRRIASGLDVSVAWLPDNFQVLFFRDLLHAHIAMGAGRNNDDALAELSEREQEVVALVAAGQPNQSIASALNLATSTVTTYKSRAKEKLGPQRWQELVGAGKRRRPRRSRTQ
jgi:DNA-binding CsgD family transcriptional regulator